MRLTPTVPARMARRTLIPPPGVPPDGAFGRGGRGDAPAAGKKNEERQPGQKAGRPVHPEEEAEIVPGEESPDDGADGRPEVAGQPVEHETPAPDAGGADLGHGGRDGRKEGRREQAVKEHAEEDGRKAAAHAQGEERQPRPEHAELLGRPRPDPVAGLASEQGPEQHPEPVGAQDLARLEDGEPEPPRQIEGQEEDDHRPAHVDEQDEAQGPGVPGQAGIGLAIPADNGLQHGGGIISEPVPSFPPPDVRRRHRPPAPLNSEGGKGVVARRMTRVSAPRAGTTEPIRPTARRRIR